jgi:hypothetical protein|nr:MAG TPA: Major tail protein [Bacteriophage sp.]
MAYIIPDSIIYILSGVECDRDYNHIKWFNSRAEQQSYMLDHRIKTYDRCTYVRDGVVNIEAWADDIYSANYMMFQNSAFSDRWFYAFISEVRYENNRTAEVHYTIDLWQTWWMDCEVGECFVEREHVLDDTVGAHTIPEGLEYGELNIAKETLLTDFSYKIIYGCEIAISDAQLQPIENQPTWFSGSTLGRVFQGSKLGYTENPDDLLQFLQNIITAGYSNTILQVFTIPKALSPSADDESLVKYKELPTFPDNFYGYKPHNNKMFCSPYCDYLVYAPTGDNMVLHPELFSDNKPELTIRGNKSAQPQVLISPRHYKRISTTDYTKGFTLNYGEKGSFLYDAYQAEIASYGFTQITEKLPQGSTDLGLTLGALAKYSSRITSGVNNAVGGFAQGGYIGAITNSGVGILDSLAQHSKDTHDTSRLSGASNGSLLWSSQLKDVRCQVKMIKAEYARTIDQFFDMYGYKVNRVKRPQIEGRPSWNYIKCKNVALTGKIPVEAEMLIKSVIESGVTFWKTTFHNYSANNKI